MQPTILVPKNRAKPIRPRFFNAHPAKRRQEKRCECPRMTTEVKTLDAVSFAHRRPSRIISLSFWHLASMDSAASSGSTTLRVSSHTPDAVDGDMQKPVSKRRLPAFARVVFRRFKIVQLQFELTNFFIRGAKRLELRRLFLVFIIFGSRKHKVHFATGLHKAEEIFY